MFYSFLTFLVMQMTILAITYCVHRTLPMKHPIIFIILATGTMDLIWILNMFLLTEPQAILDLLSLASGFLFTLVFADRGQKILSVFTYAVLMTVVLATINLLACLTFYLAPYLGTSLTALTDISNPSYWVMTLLVALLSTPPVFVCSHLLRKLFANLQESRSLLWFLTIPLSQAVLMMMINLKFDSSRSYDTWTALLPGLMVCIAADIACVLGYRKYYQLSQDAMQVRRAEQQLNIQNEYYREMQKNIMAVNEIRHDLKNQLKTAYFLLDQGHPEEVRKQLDLLQGYIQQKVGTHYCDNLMVDAVLTEKAASCEKLGIPLQISALVPSDLPIECAHLCSTFSNLLDNSIQAAQAAGKPREPVVLRSDIQGSYLTILCSNPSQVPESAEKKDILRRHGLGLQILQRLAQTYDGSLQTDFSDSRFHVTMMLKIK